MSHTPKIDKAKLPSRHVSVGPKSAPHRSYYYAMGMTEEEIELLTAEMTEMVEMIKGEAYIDIDKFVKTPE